MDTAVSKLVVSFSASGISVMQATSSSYGKEDMCGPPATTVGFIDPGQIHTVVLRGSVTANAFFGYWI